MSHMLDFPTYTTFIYGTCTEDQLSNMIKSAENDGAIFLQAIAGMVMPPQSAVALPGTRQAPVPVFRILVRMPDKAYAKLVARTQGASQNGAH